MLKRSNGRPVIMVQFTSLPALCGTRFLLHFVIPHAHTPPLSLVVWALPTSHSRYLGPKTLAMAAPKLLNLNLAPDKGAPRKDCMSYRGSALTFLPSFLNLPTRLMSSVSRFACRMTATTICSRSSTLQPCAAVGVGPATACQRLSHR